MDDQIGSDCWEGCIVGECGTGEVVVDLLGGKCIVGECGAGEKCDRRQVAGAIKQSTQHHMNLSTSTTNNTGEMCCGCLVGVD